MIIYCVWEENNNDTYHSKLFYLFNNKPWIIFLWRQIVFFAELYSDLENTSSWLFEKNGAYYLCMKLSSSFIDISLVALIELIDVTSTYSSVLSKCFPLSSHVWSINPAESWRDDISSLILFL